MVQTCWVQGCSMKARSNDGGKTSFYSIPTVRKHEGQQTEELSRERRQLWLKRIGRKAQPTKYSRVCAQHFVTGKPSELYKKNHPDWAPSLKLRAQLEPDTDVDQALQRYNRLCKRKETTCAHKAATALLDLAETSVESIDDNEHTLTQYSAKNQMDFTEETTQDSSTDECEIIQVDSEDCAIVNIETLEAHTQVVATGKMDDRRKQRNSVALTQNGAQTLGSIEEINDKDFEIKLLQSQIQRVIEENTRLKKEIASMKFDLESFRYDNDKVQYYTGLPCYQTLKLVSETIEPYVPKSLVLPLTNFDKIMLTLMKLRLNLETEDLAYRYGIAVSAVPVVFSSVLNVMKIKLKDKIPWPERSRLRSALPIDFHRKVGYKIVVVFDCFEVNIEKSSSHLLNGLTQSDSTPNDTVKFLIAMCPWGLVFYISKAWKQDVSEKHLAENCGLLDKLLPEDIVLVNRGSQMAAESQGFLCAEVVSPSAKNGWKPQLSPANKDLTWKVAKSGIHEKRFIGLMKNKFAFLQSALPVNYVRDNNNELDISLIEELVFVACALSNICETNGPKD